MPRSSGLVKRAGPPSRPRAATPPTDGPGPSPASGATDPNGPAGQTLDAAQGTLLRTADPAPLRPVDRPAPPVGDKAAPSPAGAAETAEIVDTAETPETGEAARSGGPGAPSSVDVAPTLVEPAVDADHPSALPTVRAARPRHRSRAHRRSRTRQPELVGLALIALVALSLVVVEVVALAHHHTAAAAATTTQPARPAAVVAAAQTLTGDVTLYQDNIQQIIDDDGAIEEIHNVCGGTGTFSALGVGAPVSVRNAAGATVATGRITSGTWISITTSSVPGADGVPGRTLNGVTLPGLPSIPPQTISAGFCDLGFVVDGVPPASSYSVIVPAGGPAVFTAHQLDAAHWHATFSVGP